MNFAVFFSLEHPVAPSPTSRRLHKNYILDLVEQIAKPLVPMWEHPIPRSCGRFSILGLNGERYSSLSIKTILLDKKHNAHIPFQLSKIYL